MWRQLSGKKWKCWDVLPIMREKWWVSAVLWLFAKHQSSWFVCVWCVPNKKKVLAKKIVKLEEEHEYEEYGDMTSISSADWGRWRCYISICEDDTNVDINERIIEGARKDDDRDDTQRFTTRLLGIQGGKEGVLTACRANHTKPTWHINRQEPKV